MIRRAFSRNPIPYIDAIAMQGLGVSMLHKSWHLRRANGNTFCYIKDKSTAEQPPCANETVLHVFCTLSSPSWAADIPIKYFFFHLVRTIEVTVEYIVARKGFVPKFFFFFLN